MQPASTSRTVTLPDPGGADSFALLALAQTITGVKTYSAQPVLNAGIRLDAATSISSAGTSRTDATALTHTINNLTTVLSGEGVILPDVSLFGVCIVNNLGANPVKVYGQGSDTVDGNAGTVGVTLTNTKRAIFVRVAAATWISLMGLPAA